MKLIINIFIVLFLFINSAAAEKTTTQEQLEKKLEKLEEVIGTSIKAISGKGLSKKNTEKFLSEYVLILQDERGDGVVTYFFNDKEYVRYKEYEKISVDAWRFTKTGRLRIFNKNIKLSWRIKLGKENNINIKAKFDPIGKLYNFDYQSKDEFLNELKMYDQKKLAEKQRLEKEKIDAQKKVEQEKKQLEQEKLDALEKAEQEKKQLEQKNLDAQKKAEEEKKQLENQIAKQKKVLEEEKARLEGEIAKQKQVLEEEKARLESEIAKQKQVLEEEKARLEQEKTKLEEEIAEQKQVLEKEKARLEEEITEQKRKLELEKLYIELEPQFRKKCEKKLLNDLYEIGTPEYKNCILNKGSQ